MAKTTKGIVDSINVRMYRAGTGDFFILKFKSGAKETFKMMIDCGCINAGNNTFVDFVDDLAGHTKNEIDLLVVTHEHADHINGFQMSKNQFKDIRFKEVWFAWTESKDDHQANEYRKKYTKVKLALTTAKDRLNGLQKKGYFEGLFKNEQNEGLMIEAQKNFVSAFTELEELNALAAAGDKIPTMEDKLRSYSVIKDDTEVRFLDPGKLIENIPGAEGIRFFIMGPPRNLTYLSQEEKKGEGYSKREKPSTIDFSLVNALSAGDASSASPFDQYYQVGSGETNKVIDSYKDNANQWRNIDNDWLQSSGSLALRFQQSINNTSLVMAIQFVESERILLFPGDAEYGNWTSWHDGLQWTFNQKGKSKTVNAEYILNNTVFYKVGHHLSQNGTAKEKGFEMMKSNELTAMATLDLAAKKINKGWLNTMPNDILGAGLINKTKGKLLFVGDHEKIIKNIKTKRVSVSAADSKAFDNFNNAFKGKLFLDCDVTG